MKSAKALVLLCAVLLPLCLPSAAAVGAAAASAGGKPSWPFPQGPGDPPVDIGPLQEKFLQLVDGVWDKVSARVGFCLGSSQQRVLRLMQASFPVPLPVGPSDDEVCGNATRVAAALCGRTDMEEYYKYLLLTDNLEKGGAPEAMACCPGYFCPPMLTCMMPCPLGAFCPRAVPRPPPWRWVEGSAQETSWCAPYAYRERSGIGCGGADKWTIIPVAPYPGRNTWWDFGSGNLFCNGGWFCPNTTTRLPCPEGYFCRRGSESYQRCPPLMKCPQYTEVPDENHAGFTMDACLFFGLWLLWQVSTWYNDMIKRMSLRTRLKITAAPSEYESVEQPAAQGIDVRLTELRQEHDLHDGGKSADASGVHTPLPPRAGAFARVIARLSPSKRHLSPPADVEGTEGSFTEPVWAGFEGPNMAPSPTRLPLMTNPLSHQGEGEDDILPEQSAMSGGLPNLLTSPLSGMHGGYAPNRIQLHVEFTNLSLRLKSTGKKVLAGVTGSLRAACLTAIMGPSGAGKTTLMNTLAGKASYGKRRGLIQVNGQPDSLDNFTRVMGFVPQDDIMHVNLTVEENLMFSARYRLPSHYTHSQHVFYVERAIQVLQLEEVRGEVVGDEEVRGISGGQRKRANIGLELVADPLLLFLDEPTSGLDSTSSKLVVAALQQVTRMGVTATAVIHQPSFGIFLMFDDLLLLCKGGRTAYYGRLASVQDYFESLGYVLPLHANPADVYMDIIAGLFGPSQPARQQGSTAASPDAQSAAPADRLITAEDLPAMWEAHTCEGRQSSEGDEGGLLSDEEDVEQSLQRTGALERPKPIAGGMGLKHWKVWLRSAWVAIIVARALARQRFNLLRHDVVSLLPNLRRWQRGQPLLTRPSAFRDEEEDNTRGWLAQGRALFASRRDSLATTRAAKASRRFTPGLRAQFRWCCERGIVQRMREPLAAFLNYGIFAITGSLLGMMSDRGRGTIMHVDVDTLYNNVALGLLSTVSGLKTFGAHRAIFRREAASGLNKLAYFLALDLLGNAGTLMRAMLYLVMYQSFAQPRAVLWQMYIVTSGIIYACMGIAYFLSQVLEPAAGQLTAAVVALMSSLTARNHHAPGMMGMLYQISFARWGLEGYIIAEANRLTGVWLLARCADLQALDMDVTQFGRCIAMLGFIGVLFRFLAILIMYVRT
ncbi:hypothetical protein WJX73_006860 [Symbiochloris irregularis]|uniref:ABC transporter domain-containing protein n=1 Tax=Symbiochloris irregularis TaxID=706552 RepID=A0AAW1PZ69_9CHLO